MSTVRLFDPNSLQKAAHLTAKHLLNKIKYNSEYENTVKDLRSPNVCIEYILLILNEIKYKINSEKCIFNIASRDIILSLNPEYNNKEDTIINTIISKYKENNDYIPNPTDYPLIKSDQMRVQKYAEKYLETYKKLEHFRKVKSVIESCAIRKPLYKGCEIANKM